MTSEFLQIMEPYFYPWASEAWINLKHHFTTDKIVSIIWAYDDSAP